MGTSIFQLKGAGKRDRKSEQLLIFKQMGQELSLAILHMALARMQSHYIISVRTLGNVVLTREAICSAATVLLQKKGEWNLVDS